MHPRLGELVQYIQAQRACLLAAVATVPESRRDLRVTEDKWSVAEILEHLHRVEKGVARLLVHLLDRARAEGTGTESDTGSLLDSLDRFRLTQREPLMIAPEPVRPRGGLSSVQALAALGESRKALLSALEDTEGIALGATMYPHPLLGPLNFYQWVLFVGQHEARHAGQIEDIAPQPRDLQ